MPPLLPMILKPCARFRGRCTACLPDATAVYTGFDHGCIQRGGQRAPYAYVPHGICRAGDPPFCGGREKQTMNRKRRT